MKAPLKLSGITLVVIIAGVYLQSCTKPKPSNTTTAAQGTAMFYTEESTNWLPIVVTIQGVNGTQTITQNYSSQPDCSAAGCAVFSLDPGTYYWSVRVGNFAGPGGSVYVASNNCSATQIQ